MKYEKPDIEILLLDNQDIVTASTSEGDTDGEIPWDKLGE